MELKDSYGENSAALMTSDRGNSGGAELTTPVHPDYNMVWENGPNGIYEKPVVGLNPNATVFQTKTDLHWDGLNANDYQYTNGDIVRDQGGVITPTLSPLPELGLNNPMVYSYESNNCIDNGEDPLLDLDDETHTRQLIKSQLETCLSRENLASDTYLQSQMDADQYVPIATIAQLQQIQQLTNNQELILELLKECPNVQVDEKGEKVRPIHNRCTVILREIPDTTPLEDVKELFASEKCPKFTSCEFAHNSNWFVTFDSDADAQSAYQYLREEVKTFLGKPIMARIKAKPLVKVSYPRNGYKNPYRNQQQLIQQQAQPTQSTEGQQPQQTPQFQVQQQVPLMSTIPNYSQQTIPFFPNHPNLIQWQANPIMDPSMVLAINGYQATSVKVNAPMRAPFTNMAAARTNRNPRQSNRLGNQERGNVDNRPSHDRQPQNHRTSPRMSDNQQISGHHSYQNQSRRALDNNANHSNVLQTTSNVDNNSNITAGRQSESSSRYVYKSRRREPLRNGSTRLQQLNNMKDKQEPQFDFEMNSFPPLPGPSTTSAPASTTSNEVFENKLSDVVKGTAKPQVRETKPQNNAIVSQPHPVSPAVPPRSVTPPQPQKDNSNNSSSAINGTSAISSQSSTPTRVPSPPPVSPQKSQKTPPIESPPQKVVEVVQTPVKVTPVTSTQVKVVEKERPSPARLSYAQMVQKGREEENTAEGKPDDLSDNSGNESPQCSRKTLKEQSQTQKSAPSHTPSKEHGRRDFEPKEQRHGSGRRAAKENRIDRRDRRRDRNDREGSRSSVSSAK